MTSGGYEEYLLMLEGGGSRKSLSHRAVGPPCDALTYGILTKRRERHESTLSQILDPATKPMTTGFKIPPRPDLTQLQGPPLGSGPAAWGNSASGGGWEEGVGLLPDGVAGLGVLRAQKSKSLKDLGVSAFF